MINLRLMTDILHIVNADPKHRQEAENSLPIRRELGIAVRSTQQDAMNDLLSMRSSLQSKRGGG